ESGGGFMGKGSVRGFKGVDVLEGLQSCSKYLDRFGGHKAAAGLTVKEENIDEFRKAFVAHMNEKIGDGGLEREIELDAVVRLGDINSRLLSEFERISPFGLANRKPLLGAMDTNIVFADVVGRNHLKMKVSQDGNVRECIAFGMAEDMPKKKKGYNIAFYPYIDEWQGVKSMKLNVRDIALAVTA
ncbi:MAG: hypothetical protein KAR06_06860, partial [Deltaproteobacteria bacterium]|nr:hypothetical protein [Deltaproteobacteria bacterium]